MLPTSEYLESLPKKRMGAGCLLFDEHARLLMVKPTYKPDWEIPGGVVEKDESPLQCCHRELREELGLDRLPGGLLAVDYNNKQGEYTEALMFIFFGGVLSQAEIVQIRLPETELSEFRFFDRDELPEKIVPRLRRRVLLAWDQIGKSGGLYLEDQEEVPLK